MFVRSLFSYRKRVAKGELPDVWEYNLLSESLRNQIVFILRDALGTKSSYENWETIGNTVAREHGVMELAVGYTPREQCEKYLSHHPCVDEVFDFIEAAFSYIDTIVRHLNFHNRRSQGIRKGASDAIAELNERFRRAGVGYTFEEGQILRIDSDLIHSEIVRPALQYLNQSGFEGPQNEFLKAHAHYRASEMKEAIVDANNAFESSLKVICDQRSWKYERGARASDLLKIVRSNGLLPDYLEKSFDQLAATLRSGLPKVRDQEGAHGQGSKARDAPIYVASYALHLAAVKILFLTQAHQATK